MYATLHPKHFVTYTDAWTGTDVGAWVWSEVEVCVAIICACLPTLRALFCRIFHKRGRSTGPEVVDLTRLRTAMPEERPGSIEAADGEDNYPSRVFCSHVAEVPSSPLKLG